MERITCLAVGGIERETCLAVGGIERNTCLDGTISVSFVNDAIFDFITSISNGYISLLNMVFF